MDPHDAAVRRVQGRIGWVLGVRYGLALVSGWLFLWGTAVLVGRTAFGLERASLLWGGLGLLLALGVAAWMAWRRVPDGSRVRALLDRHGRAGGLVMSAAEVDLGGWRARLPAPSLPVFRLRRRRAVVFLASASAYLVVAFALPAGFADFAGRRPLDVSDDVARLAAQIETLEEEELIDSEESATLQEEIERMRRNALGADPVKTWEALDHLEERLAQTAEEAAEQAASDSEKLADTEALATALERAGELLDGTTFEGALRELAEMARRAEGAFEARLDADLLERLRELATREGLDGRDREALEKLRAQRQSALGEFARASRMSREQLLAMVRALSDARLIDAARIGQCEKAGRCNSEGLLAILGEDGGQCDTAGLLALVGSCNRPGRGGVSRGRGDAPLTWQDPSSREGVAFEEEVLPPGAARLEDSHLMGVSAGAPTADDTAAPSGGAALDGAQAGGGSAHTHTVLPRHRGAVKRYFARP